MSQTQQWIDALKRCLKARGMTYRQLGEKLDLSEATVKRMFSKQTVSLERLEDICRLLDMKLADLARMSEAASEQRQTSLSMKQEKALAADPVLLSYFYLLLNGWKNQRIAAKFGLTPHRQTRLLSALDRLGLIELGVKNHVRLLTARRIQWRPNGPVRKLYEGEVKQAFLRDEFEGNIAQFSFETAELAPESARLIIRRMGRLGEEFDELTELDRNLGPTQKQGFGLMVAMRPWAYWNIIFSD